jgi:cell division protein FtsN
MARDFARKHQPAAGRKQAAASKKQAAPVISGWRWYLSGLFSGLLVSFLVYLGTLPPAPGNAGEPPGQTAQEQAGEQKALKPRFDFYTMLPEQSIAADTQDPAEAPTPAPQGSPIGKRELFVLQAGSFRQREDAERRRAELLLLGLEPRVEEASGDNGRWFRVFLGPFESHAEMTRARGLTTTQHIDTLLLKRAGP